MRHPLVAAIATEKDAATDLSFLLLEQAQILDGELPRIRPPSPSRGRTSCVCAASSHREAALEESPGYPRASLDFLLARRIASCETLGDRGRGEPLRRRRNGAGRPNAVMLGSLEDKNPGFLENAVPGKPQLVASKVGHLFGW